MSDPVRKIAWPVRAYHTSRRLFDLSLAAARAIFVGTWLGLLDRHSWHAADEDHYSRARMYHDESYNLSGLFPWEAAAVDRHFQRCRSLLLSSAGGGREAIALERRGLEVFAFECHPQLVQIANELLSRHGLKTRIVLVPRDECPTSMPTCDGAIVGWASYMLIQQRTIRIRFLQRLRAHLPAGAPLLLSFFARSGDTRPVRLAATIANGLRTIRRRERAEVGDDLVPYFVHRFSEHELSTELDSASFRLVEFSTDGYPHAVAVAVDGTAVGSVAPANSTILD
jgi:hypothetical protein